ncbi:unnamed protein product [Acanthoscelides obtectus]|uniref:Uncharacterized protein n=1 Tax=Acanthoscelides obtectus TaxID=200917 RepID=A0A9P0KI95_ACAOB|nr:unnamed protein product [Acanthoscelides obtectus]CAK1635506.1 hypothetical protein AOBTE_LOCUS9323 [Acanthoscelides obtectus]
MQASSQRAFDEWVKTIAIELIRQTPLDAIKYLDILTIAECWKRRDDLQEKDWNYNDCPSDKTKANGNDDAMEECVTCQSESAKTGVEEIFRREPLVIRNREQCLQ